MDYISENSSLTEEIAMLIESHREGGYWDFKKQWYSFDNNDNKAKIDLLHDIICMANNLCNRDAYLIIGVDEEHDYAISGVNEDINRRKTQHLVDFLKDKHFAGDIRPVVRVVNIVIGDREVDIIVIENSSNTPFYLRDSYNGIVANNIYTRVQDENTCINKSADIDKVEYLWKKRFRIDSTPLERMKYYLNFPDMWVDSLDKGQSYIYCQQFPEMTIRQEIDNDRNGYEFYMFAQTDKTPYWFVEKFYFHQTPLCEFLGIGLDGCRCYIIAPTCAGIRFGEQIDCDVRYSYYEKGTTEYALLQFHIKHDGYFNFVGPHKNLVNYAFDNFMRYILIFYSTNERLNFNEYVKNNEARYLELFDGEAVPNYFAGINSQDLNLEFYRKELKDAAVMKKMLMEFRQNNRNSF